MSQPIEGYDPTLDGTAKQFMGFERLGADFVSGNGDNKMSKKWREVEKGIVQPICPYGCGEPGQLKGVMTAEDGQMVGVFCDSDGCEFRAPIKLRDNPSNKKIIKDADGNLIETNSV